METNSVVKSRQFTGIYVKKELGGEGAPDKYYVVVLSRNRSKTLVLTNMNDFTECTEEESNKFMDKLKSLNYSLDSDKCEFVYSMDDSKVPDVKVGDVIRTSKSSDEVGIIMSKSVEGTVLEMKILYIDQDKTIRTQTHKKDVRRFGGVEKCNEETSTNFKYKLSEIVATLVS